MKKYLIKNMVFIPLTYYFFSYLNRINPIWVWGDCLPNLNEMNQHQLGHK